MFVGKVHRENQQRMAYDRNAEKDRLVVEEGDVTLTVPLDGSIYTVVLFRTFFLLLIDPMLAYFDFSVLSVHTIYP